MPRKKRTIVEETLPDSGGSGEPEDSLSAFDVALESVEDVETLRDVMENFGQTGELLKVYRETGEYCYQSDTVDEAFIQKNFGGGEYRIRIFINAKYRKTIPVKIAAPPHSENGNGNGNSDAHHREFLEKLVLAQIAGGGNNKGPTIIELTTALSNLDGLRGKQEGAMDIFQKGVQFARDIMDLKQPASGDWKSEAIGAVKEALPVVGAMIAGRIPPPPNPETPNPEIPNVITQPQAPTQEQQIKLIKTGLDYLKKQCLKGVNPELIVEWIENNAEDYQHLIDMVLNIPFEEFVKIDAQIGNEPFHKWFSGLFNGLRSAFVPANSVGDDSPGDVGDSDNAGNHGEPRKVTKLKSK